jgi:hypothetical protein
MVITTRRITAVIADPGEDLRKAAASASPRPFCLRLSLEAATCPR